MKTQHQRAVGKDTPVPRSVLVVLSGGMDSTAVLAFYHSLLWKVEAISFDYGQRHRVELEAAALIASRYNTPHRVVDLRALRDLFGETSQTGNVPVPHGHYTDESMKKTVVPNRNMVMLSIATAWAITRGLGSVAFGAHAGDHTIYPDCRPEFADALHEAILLCDWKRVELAAPFIGMTKSEIARLGTLLGAPFDLTWSCYEGGTLHCGLCGTCMERQEAFREAKVKDPTVYQPRPGSQPLWSTKGVL